MGNSRAKIDTPQKVKILRTTGVDFFHELRGGMRRIGKTSNIGNATSFYTKSIFDELELVMRINTICKISHG
jgi:hypothetical protein